MQSYTGLSGKSGNDFGAGKPYITYKQVFDGGNISIEDCPLVNINASENQNKVEYGDILITTSSETANEVGYTNVIDKKPHNDTYLNSFCFGLRPLDLKFPNILFSKYLFKNNEYRNAVVLLAQGVTRYNISKTKVVELKLSIPKNIAEQKKIAACLSSLDDVIEGYEEKLTTLKEHKKGLMQNLFPKEKETQPKYRFPEFENNSDWREKKLGDFADVSKLAGYEFTKHIKYENKGSIIALRGLNIKNNSLSLDDVKYIDNSDLSMLSRSKLYIDDLMFTYIGTIGEVALIPENDKFYLAPNVARIRINKIIALPQFILQYFNNDTFKKNEIAGYISSSSQPALTMENIRKFIVKIPEIQEQKKIAEVLSSVDELIVAQREKIETLKEHKKGLMQGLFPKIES